MLDAFVELDADGGRRTATAAPYLDCRPATTEEIAIVGDVAKADWLTGDLGQAALEVAITQAMPGHLAEVRARTEERVTKTKAAVHQRLTRDQLLGPPGVRAARADASRPPAAHEPRPRSSPRRRTRHPPQAPHGRTRPRGNNPGFDIKSFDRNGDLLFIEVKGRLAGADTVTVTRNEILHGLNSADRFILALVEVHPDGGEEVRYADEPARCLGHLCASPQGCRGGQARRFPPPTLELLRSVRELDRLGDELRELTYNAGG